jgi:hypothetical protein
MSSDMICYTFSPTIPVDEIESSLLLALFGTESLHGEARTRLEAPHRLDRSDRRVVIDASTDPGRDFNRLFLGFVTREFGANAFHVERLTGASETSPRRGFPPAEWN